MENLPYAFHPFRNHVLVGVGNLLRYYEIGKKKLLKKAENRDFQSGVINIQSINERVFVTDMSDSLHVYKYKQKVSPLIQDNCFFEIADDVLPRWITSMTILDYQTVAVSDKFENFSVLRLPLSNSLIQTSTKKCSKTVWPSGT